MLLGSSLPGACRRCSAPPDSGDDSTWILTTDGRTRRAISENWFSTGSLLGTTSGEASETGSPSGAAPTRSDTIVPIRMPISSVHAMSAVGRNFLWNS